MKPAKADIEQRRLAANAVAIFFTLLVLCVTLYPFELTTVGFEERLRSLQAQNLFKLKGLVDDVVVNILLFLPVGFSFGLVYARSGRSNIGGFLIVTLSGLAMSGMVEFLQLYIPFRFSSYLDIISNGIGAAAGFGISLFAGEAFLARVQSLRPAHHRLSRSVILYAGWWAFFLLLVFPLTYALRTNDWDKKTPLTVGSNADGSGKVSGSITYFGLTKMGMSEQEIQESLQRGSLVPARPTDVMAEYKLRGAPPYPSLVKHSTSLTLNEQGILRTKSAFTHAASWIMFTTLFTAYIDYTLAAPADERHETLVMLGRRADDISFAVMRDSDKLVIAIRSMVTGYSAHHPMYVVPGFFGDAGEYRIIVTHDQLRLRVYKNDLHNPATFNMGPGLALTNRFLPTRSQINITSPLAGINEWLFAALVFVPLGLCSGKMVSLARARALRVLLAISLVALPVFSINYACAYMLFRPFDQEHSLLCAGLMAVAITITLFATQRQPQSRASEQAVPLQESSIVHEHCS